MKGAGGEDGGRWMAGRNARQKENRAEVFPRQVWVCGFRSQ